MIDQGLEDNISENEEESIFLDVDILQKHGINVADIKKLKNAGICTIKGVQMTTKKKLCNIKGFSDTKVEKIKEACQKVVALGFMTALEVSDRRKQVFKISTGSIDLDKLLGGGVESMAITEVFGEFRTGKTQMSHTLCVTTQIPNSSGYHGGKVMFLDTEHTFLRHYGSRNAIHPDSHLLEDLLYFIQCKGEFYVTRQGEKSERGLLTHVCCVGYGYFQEYCSRPDRLRPIADRFNLDQNAVLDNVLYARAYTSEHQAELLDYVAAKFYEEAGVFKLLIIDSIMALFRVDFSGRGELADRQQKLAQVLSRLQKISEEYNVAVFITNQMTADPGATMSFQADPKKPIGGNILAHASTTRISLRKGRGENRIAKIYDSPDLPESEATFAITSGGVSDAKD